MELKKKHLKTIVPIATIGKMDITTIQLSKETKNKISSFGVKGESYDNILKRIYSMAVKEQVREFLMSGDGFISLDEFEREVNKKWPKSR